MFKKIFLFLLVAGATIQNAMSYTPPTVPDSAYLFTYSTLKNGGRNGMHFAYSTDKKNWISIGPEMRFLFCDYGRWGKEKRLITPYLFLDNKNIWHCIWSLNEYDGAVAHSTSKDLIYWTPQTYPIVSIGKSCMEPSIFQSKNKKSFVLQWLGSDMKSLYQCETSDFKTYSTSVRLSSELRINNRVKVTIRDKEELGTINRISWEQVEKLLDKKKLEDYKRTQNSESVRDDATKFNGLKPIDATITVDLKNKKQISNKLLGVFFEDINYAADGGLYAEQIQNRDFEYDLSDKENNDKSWDAKKAWTLNGGNASFEIDTIKPIHKNNPHYAVYNIGKPGASLVNEGFDGIVLNSGDKYDLSLFARTVGKNSGKVTVQITDENGNVGAKVQLNLASSKWKKVKSVITATKSISKGKLEIIAGSKGMFHLDMVSLFPQKTFKNRKNGLRNDLAQSVADIHPKFVRFPGGCVSHGDGLGNIYKWENTIGPLEARKPQKNLWGYHQSAGLGYFEYFQYCEDMGAEPLPVVAAGVPCQNSNTGGAGQQGGIPMCDMDNYVQSVLNLIEWANGSVKTKWGKMRADAGHPASFNLKYVGIGNEDLINDIFEERFEMIYKAVKEKYPNITVIGTVGPASEGTDYVEGWKIAEQLKVPIVDEHYYQPVGWFLNNNQYYDVYDRSKSKVYLGEYASHGSTLYNALVEAQYMTALERNGDIVAMSSYAPLLAKEGHTQWNPDLIYFNNTEVKPSVNYYVQKYFGVYSGDNYIASKISLSENKEDILKRFSTSVVTDSKTGNLIIRMVNLLPVEVNTQLKLSDLKGMSSSARQIILSGDPNDKKAVPAEYPIQLNQESTLKIPPYSFEVLVIQPEKTGK